MKVLWFTTTPSKAAKEFGSSYMGGGWISSLESLIVNEQRHEIGICFFYNGEVYKKLNKDGINYYGIPYKKENTLQRIINRQVADLNDTKSEYIDEVIADFKPDLVHVFGTEMGYGDLLINKFDKVLFHLQGLVAPYAEVYFPLGFNKNVVLKNSGLSTLIRGISFFHKYRIFEKRAEREVRIIKNWKYFTGRTDWDKNYTKLLNPEASYFHCEEALRSIFFTTEWQAPDNIVKDKTIIIGTTINPNIYKGLDLIYKVLDLLGNYKIHWKVFGLKEDDGLNKLVKRTLKIPLIGKSTLKLYGPLAAPALLEELKTCHFFVHPSYIDNSPNSICEAMLLGMPVVSSAVGGVKSLITHNENGFLFNPYDKFDLAGLLVSLINNYDKAITAGQNARKTALKRHSPDEILSELNKIYTAVYNS
jgi:glycosyltransferase involved in cell wall biosynthesis